jgi:hypothetical protein
MATTAKPRLFTTCARCHRSAEVVHDGGGWRTESHVENRYTGEPCEGMTFGDDDVAVMQERRRARDEKGQER